MSVSRVACQLNEYRRETPGTKTDTLLAKLMLITVETGAVTTIVAIVEVLLFIKFPTNNLHQML